MRSSGSWGTVALVAAAALTLALPVLANGFPFYFNDSADYIHIGRDIVDTLLKRLAEAPAAPAVAAAAGPTAPMAPAPEPMGLTMLASRSAYFGLTVAGAMAVLGVWGPVVLQALLSAWVLWLLVRVHGPPRPRRAYLALVAVLTLASSLPFFVGFVMPDLYGGLGVAAALLLALHWPRLSGLERGALFVLAAAAGAFHTTTWMLVLVTAIGAGGLLWATTRARPVGAAVGVGAAAASVSAIVAFGLAVQAFYGVRIDNPPFLMARVLADGPGRAYLAASCAEKGWAICAHRHKPLEDANQILWDPNPVTGVFFPADYDGRRRMNAEETAFVVGSTLDDPLGQAAASARNALGQLAMIRISPEFGATRRIWRESLLRDVLPAEPYLAARVYQGTYPLGAFDMGSALLLAASLAFLGGRLARRDGDADERLFACLVLALGLAVLGNAVLCGAASGPSARYQTRLIWLVPAVALAGMARFGLTRRRGA